MQEQKEWVPKVGETVIATGDYHWRLTKGQEYVVTKYEEEFRDTNFTWPAYVTVIGDSGKPVTGHVYRFAPKAR